MELALDEPTEGDAVIEVGEIAVIFNRQDKLYVHKSIIDYSDDYPGNGFKVTPFFNGFNDC